mmetsp:Transcript_40311/g.89525  ORF Transcript_40311/g.89525 Transcript_40311/m.89525 type:complete len:214 (-) Transcript_40311:216-857(-)
MLDHGNGVCLVVVVHVAAHRAGEGCHGVSSSTQVILTTQPLGHREASVIAACHNLVHDEPPEVCKVDPERVGVLFDEGVTQGGPLRVTHRPHAALQREAAVLHALEPRLHDCQADAAVLRHVSGVRTQAAHCKDRPATGVHRVLHHTAQGEAALLAHRDGGQQAEPGQCGHGACRLSRGHARCTLLVLLEGHDLGVRALRVDLRGSGGGSGAA